MKEYKLCFFIIVLIIQACDNRGYKKIDDNVSYKLVRFESDSAQINHGDMCYFTISTRTNELKEAEIYPRSDYVFVCDTNSIYWTRYLEGFSSGDSIIFRLDSDELFNPTIDDYVQVNVGIEWVMPLNDKSEKERGSLEFAHIYQYMMERGYDPMESLFNSIYVLELGEGTGNINMGDLIVLHSEIYLLNDSLIYDSKKKNSPLYFNVGQEGQVVPGVETALRIMTYDARCEIILPSTVAFGEDGSFENGIDPYTPVRMVLFAERQLAISQE